MAGTEPQLQEETLGALESAEPRADSLALQQTHAQLPDPLRARLSATMNEFERLANRARALLAEVARRTPPPE
jgi:hypothetical protein